MKVMQVSWVTVAKETRVLHLGINAQEAGGRTACGKIPGLQVRYSRYNTDKYLYNGFV